MSLKKILNWSICTLVGLCLAPALIVFPVAASSQPAQVPPDFNLIESGSGVSLYSKDYPGGTPDYVLLVNLNKKAGLQFLTGTVGSAGTGSGYYGGDNPSYARRSLSDFWTDFSGSNSKAFCVLNGAFFSSNDDPAQLAFPLKVDGTLASGGGDGGSYEGKQMMLEIWSDHAAIQSLSKDALSGSSAPDILAGLSEDADKGPRDLVGRTFVGVADLNGDGQAEEVLFLVSKTTRQADAASVLRSFGASQVMMLDGGDSAQLLCHGQPYVYSERTIPQAIGVVDGVVSDYAAILSSQPAWPVVVVGETQEITITVQNNGSVTWQPGDVYLNNVRNDWGAGQRLDLKTPLAPDESTSFTWTTPPFDKSGVFTSSWELKRGDTTLSDHPLVISLVAIPKELESRKVELQNQIHQWAQDQVNNIENLVLQWLQQQIHTGVQSLFDKVCPSSAALPGVALAITFWLWRRKRHL